MATGFLWDPLVLLLPTSTLPKLVGNCPAVIGCFCSIDLIDKLNGFIYLKRIEKKNASPEPKSGL